MKKILFGLGLICLLSVPVLAEDNTSAGINYKSDYRNSRVSISHSTVTFSSITVHTIDVIGFQEIVVNPTTADYFYRIDGSTLSLTTVGIRQTDNTTRNVLKAYGEDVSFLLVGGSSDETVAISVLTP